MSIETTIQHGAAVSLALSGNGRSPAPARPRNLSKRIVRKMSSTICRTAICATSASTVRKSPNW